MSTSRLLIAVGIVLLLALVLFIAFKPTKSAQESASSALPLTEPTADQGIRYLALGDSYTIGQSVAESGRWPNQLIEQLNAAGKKTTLVGNPSVTGFNTQNLIDYELPLVGTLKPDFVTVLIGVNDYVQGMPLTTFTRNLDYILDYLQQRLAKPGNLLLVTIPDFGKTPAGKRLADPKKSEAAIKRFNQEIIRQADRREIAVADIFPLSQTVANDPTLTARDGLHPSAKQYSAWTKVIYDSLKAHHLPK